MEATVLAVLGVVVMIALIMLGMNVGMSMFFVGMVGYAIATNWTAAFGLFKTVPFTSAFTYSFTVVPLFILMGQFVFRSGMSNGLFNAAEKWLGRIRGGIAMATVAACAFFAAICGSNTATTATMGVVAYPEMKKQEYADVLSSGAITAGGTLGVLIPPSTLFILYGIIAEQSVGKLFAAGIVPGVIMAVAFVVAISIWTRLQPGIAPATKSYSWRERFASLKGAVTTIILFVVILGSIFTGIASVTEAAAVGAFLALIFWIFNRTFTWKALLECLKNTVAMSSMAIFMCMSATIFGYFLAVTRTPQMLQEFITGLDVSRYVIIAIILVIYMIMGCIMDGLAMTLITVPIFLPTVRALGFDPIWFGVIIVIVNNIGAMTPPVGLNAYVTAGVLKDVPLKSIFKGVTPFIIAALICTLLCILFPSICTWLPNMIL